MRDYRLILIFGTIEILLGSITVFFNLITVCLSTNNKSPSVLLFVILTGVASTLIGVGLLKFNKLAYILLIYFSSVIVFTKILMFMGIIQLNGALEATIPANLKRIVSISYHSVILYIFTRKQIRQVFVG